jgi:hypothetical protein
MQQKKYHRKEICSIFSLIFAIALLPALGFAQDAGQDPSKQKPAAQVAPNETANKDNQPTTPVALAWADSYIRQIGTAGLLAGTREGIGLGSIYIPSASVYGIVDQFESTNTIPGNTFTAAVLQGTLIYDHRIGRNSRIAIQYQPDMAISNGQVVGNFSNQNTSLDWLIYTRPRWNIKFTDGFRYSYTQQSVGMSYLDVNTSSGGLNTNNFLDGPTRSLSNYATLSVAYALSRRASISFSPNYTYAETGDGVNLDRAASYGGNVNWSYRLSERQTVGLQYSGELIHEAGLGNSTTTPNVPTDTVFHTFAGTAGRQISESLFVRGAAGITTSAASQNSRQWSFYGNFALVKKLGRSSLGLNYTRSDTLVSGLIASEYADRIDFTVQNQLTPRLIFTPGAGYLRQVQSGGFSGWYATSDVQYLLAPRAGLFLTFDYFRKNQSSNTLNLFSGNRNIYSFGLRWQPGRVAH